MSVMYIQHVTRLEVSLVRATYSGIRRKQKCNILMSYTTWSRRVCAVDSLSLLLSPFSHFELSWSSLCLPPLTWLRTSPFSWLLCILPSSSPIHTIILSFQQLFLLPCPMLKAVRIFNNSTIMSLTLTPKICQCCICILYSVPPLVAV
mgnify:CR=1 FL=1